ncbi:MAG: hypothetical protein E7266_06305 [Lachnospiraceae bacterium]|nr:hypothetical protein [Lachnospiraceae bacterium]
MFKKISSIVLSLVLVAIIFLNVRQFLEKTTYAYGTKDLVIGGSSETGYNYTPAGVKEVTDQEFLVICQGVRYQNIQSARSWTALPQHHPTSHVLQNMFANSTTKTYTFTEEFDKRLINGFDAGDYVTVRFGPVKSTSYTYFTVFYHYY